MKSIVEQRGAVTFPQFTGERIYMREFRKSDGLPFDLARWQPTVDAMLEGVDTIGRIWLMVDQGLVPAGRTHRRSGLHIDGYWNPGIQAHGGPTWERGPRWNDSPPGHKSYGGWLAPEAIILASDISACRALVGEFEGEPGDGFSCDHIDTSNLSEVILQAGLAYAGNVTMLHEALPVPADCLRTVVRLNVPGWSPAAV